MLNKVDNWHLADDEQHHELDRLDPPQLKTAQSFMTTADKRCTDLDADEQSLN